MLEELDDDVWAEVFKYAGTPIEYGELPEPPELAYPGCTASLEPFGPEDVRRIIASAEGDNDVEDWLMVGELNDGRFFAIRAGCDYTGWG